MSNEIGLVKFQDGTVMFNHYHGCGSSLSTKLFLTKEGAVKSGGIDVEYHDRLESAKSYEEMEQWMAERDAITYNDAEDVELFTPYGAGILWRGTASKASNVLITGITDDDCEECDDDQFNSPDDWPEWVKALGVPRTRSLDLSLWMTHLPLKYLFTEKGPRDTTNEM